ncbi:MAG TPA: gamma-glutamyltransferase [Verrucomicrobiales bacterium]|nr:gamma-glutamyltransferase [Verrucomicrobiales bacterium]
MNIPRTKPLPIFNFLFTSLLLFTSSVTADVKMRGIAIATVDPIATDAAVQALKDGGNAFDASVAAALTLGVVNGYNSGIGGGCFIVARKANGELFTINGRETAPEKAHRDMFIRDGQAQTKLSQTGALAIAVPGSLMAYSELCEKHGKLSFKSHLDNASSIALNGFKVPASFAQRVKGNFKQIQNYPASAKIFSDKNGGPIKAGSILIQKDLAKTYNEIAQHGIDWFYNGPFSKKTEEWMNKNGGIMKGTDFEKYHVTYPNPVKTTYREFTVVGMPPPSSGGTHVAQILNILEHFEIKDIDSDSPKFYHLITEAMKLAFADRAHWLGDPSSAKVPLGLVSKEYAKSLAKKIHPKKAGKVITHGTPPGSTEHFFNKHTTHFSCSDNEGNWVAITATINTSFGSKVIIPGTGVIMNNEMDDFSISPGTPNAFGLIGNEANAVAPGKRPLSSMSPTIVLKGHKPILSVGAAGGPTIISQTLLTLIHTLDHNLSIREALMKPRFHHQWQPNQIRIESTAGQSVIDSLKQMGHQIYIGGHGGATQAIGNLGKGLEAVHDPRLNGKAIVFPIQK